MGDGQGMSTTKKALITIGIVAVGVIAYKVFTAASDEPPIVVKRRSLDAEIVTNRTAEWERGAQNEEDKKNWYLKSDGTNPNETYYFKIRVSGVSCGNPPATAKRVQVDYPAQSFDIQHTGFKTKVKTKGGILRPTPKLISFPGSEGHYIEKVWVHGSTGAPWTCAFSSASQFGELCLCATQTDCASICN